MNSAHLFEALMLTCFGVSWPLGAWRMLRSRRAEGRGLLPTGLVLAGYLAGLVAKFCSAEGGGPPPIFWFYLLNAFSVSLNLALQWRFSDAPREQIERRTGLAAPACANIGAAHRMATTR